MLNECQDEKVKETLLFYSTFRAKCYLISAGGTAPHPHYSVLQGIILANYSLRREECAILLTNSRGLMKLSKLKKLRRLAPQWTRYVKIHHYDDVFFTEQNHNIILCLHPERCISDVRTNTVEWTPEGYVNALRVKLKTVTLKISNRRPLEKKCFVERSLVEITTKESELVFKAHIICIPLPHNPRSGDSINCCYVIEESIASGAHFSQALFLLDKGKCRPSRAKVYTLFQYTNNEWHIRKVSETVMLQDRSLKTPFAHNVITLQPNAHKPVFSSVCCKCNKDITSLYDIVSCRHHGCLSCAHTQCVRYCNRERGAKSVAAFVCSNHTTCCLCKKDIVRIHGIVSCNQRQLGCLNQAHARCAGYRKRQASKVTTFACPSHTCCLCQNDIIQDDDAVSCIIKLYNQQHQGCLNRAHVRCASKYTKRKITFACPSHTCCLCKQDFFQDCEIVSCRQRCLNRAHAQCAGYTRRDARSMTFGCPRHSCCLCEREIIKDYGAVSCKQHFTDKGCLNRAHAQCAGYKVRKANRVKRFSCSSCRS